MNRFFIFYISLLSIAFLLIACEDDPCKGKNCDNGVCDTVSGNCLCSRGYQINGSGTCTIEWTTKFVATYSVSDSCTGATPGTTTYSSSISSTAPDQLLISNFANLGHSMAATHSNSTSFDINLSRNDTVFSGTGSLVDTIVYIDYIINDTTNNNIDTCRATYNK